MSEEYPSEDEDEFGKYVSTKIHKETFDFDDVMEIHELLKEHIENKSLPLLDRPGSASALYDLILEKNS